MKFEVSAWDFPDFLAWLPARFFVVLPWLHFQALHPMKPQSERRDGVGPGKPGWIFSIRAHEKVGLLPVSDECWMVHARVVIRTSTMQSVSRFQIFLISKSPRFLLV